RIGRDRRVERCQLDLLGTPSPATQEVEAGIDDEPPPPGIEPVRIAETGQVPPGADEAVLDRVARELRVPDDEAGRRVQPRKRPIDARGEGGMIALPRAVERPPP